jgi:MFS family permease
MTRYYANAAGMIFFAVVQILLTLLLVKADQPGPSPADASSTGSLREGFKRLGATMQTSFRVSVRNKVFRLIFGGALTIGLTISILEQYWQPQVQSLTGDGSPGWILGFLTAGYFLSGALGNIAIAGVGKYFSRHYRLVVAALRAAIGLLFILLALQGSITGFTILYFLIFFSVGVLSSPQNTIFHRHAPAAQRSTLLSVESLFFQGGGLISSLALGAVAQHFSISVAWIIAGVVFSLSALLYLVIEEFPQQATESTTEKKASGTYEFSENSAATNPG